MEQDEIKKERRINRGNWQKIWCCVSVKSEFFPNRCFSEEHFYQAMVTKATHDQLRLTISPKTGKHMIIVNRAAIPPTGRELLRQEQQFGKNWALSHCHFGEKRQLGCPPCYKPPKGSFLACPSLLPIQPPTLHLEAITMPCVPACGSFPWRRHSAMAFLNHFPPPVVPKHQSSHATHVIAATSLPLQLGLWFK